MAYGKNQRKLGTALELDVAKFLQARGLQLIATQVRYRMGEIDLVMRDQEVLVFVEVRYRRRHDLGDGAQSVNRTKQSRIIKAAQFYLQQQTSGQDICRFDVVAGSGNPQAPTWQWIKDAFCA